MSSPRYWQPLRWVLVRIAGRLPRNGKMREALIEYLYPGDCVISFGGPSA